MAHGPEARNSEPMTKRPKKFRNILECFLCTRLCTVRVTCVTPMTDHPI